MTYAKAIVGAAAAGVAAVLSFYLGGGSDTKLAVLYGAGAALSGLLAVWRIPNKTKPGAKDAPKP